MIPIDFPGKNFTFTKPTDMTDEQCSSLPVYKGNTIDGMPVIISAWKPNYEDIQAINRGEPIYLTIIGHGMPPVSLDTENPFTIQNNNNDESKH